MILLCFQGSVAEGGAEDDTSQEASGTTAAGADDGVEAEEEEEELTDAPPIKRTFDPRVLALLRRTKTTHGDGTVATSQPAARLAAASKNMPVSNVNTAMCVHCAHCAVGFDSAQALAEHNQLTHAGEQRCHVCAQTFKTAEQLQVHLRYTHNKQRQQLYVCSFCGDRFAQKASLVAHLRSHTGARPTRPFQCLVCDKSFSVRAHCKAHMLTHHVTRKEHECELCGGVFRDVAALTRHQQLHTGHGNHLCDVCSASFYSRQALSVHLLEHRGQRPVQCHICHKTFTKLQYLMRHSVVHNKPSRHACSTCMRTFSTSQELAQHMTLHGATNTSAMTSQAPASLTGVDGLQADTSTEQLEFESHGVFSYQEQPAIDASDSERQLYIAVDNIPLAVTAADVAAAQNSRFLAAVSAGDVHAVASLPSEPQNLGVAHVSVVAASSESNCIYSNSDIALFLE